MHDLIVATVFILMLAAPCIVAGIAGRSAEAEA